jgi:prolyl-tRNA synthetase
LKNIVVVVDDEIPNLPNLTAGANEEGCHLRNVNYGRDYTADFVADIANADVGFLCPECGKSLTSQRGVEVGNIFKLGTFYSEHMGCLYLDENGESKPIVMGSYGIGIGRLMNCIAEEHHDEHGLAWSAQIAPYSIYLVPIHDNTGDTQQTAETLYASLQKAGFSVLYDDRETSPGVKFNDADLLGIPYRLTVSARSLSKGGIEIKSRVNDSVQVIAADQVINHLTQIIESKPSK